MTDDVKAEVNRQVAEEAAVIEELKHRVVYPRFLGVDNGGSLVWDLADGRWTWGDDPHSAAIRTRTFEPERYLEKYGPMTIGVKGA